MHVLGTDSSKLLKAHEALSQKQWGQKELAAFIEKKVIVGEPTIGPEWQEAKERIAALEEKAVDIQAMLSELNVPEWQEAKERIEALEEKAVDMQAMLSELNHFIETLRLTWATTGGEVGDEGRGRVPATTGGEAGDKEKIKNLETMVHTLVSLPNELEATRKCLIEMCLCSAEGIPDYS
ncbi:hypothetical protein JCGZ_04223 [Jatropha curcas]|uniref:Uncharacterized protein n=1 Tax=Jatropha curcas TaxID=180498 RepID=A0A067KUU3_JATCU|nr:hypothetical protein JCGZ_04223 [Jatropha curcas]